MTLPGVFDSPGLSSSGANNNKEVQVITTFGPFCGKKKYPPLEYMRLNICRLFGQFNSYPEELTDVEVKVGANTLHLSVKQIAAIGHRNGKNWQKLKVRKSTPESTTSDGKTPEGTSSMWFYCQLKNSEGDASYVCIKMYRTATTAYSGALPYLDNIGVADTLRFHELVYQTVIEKYVLEPTEKRLLLECPMTWDNLTCQVHYNGQFPGQTGLETAVRRIRSIRTEPDNQPLGPDRLDISYEPELTPPQLLVYKVGQIPECNLNPLPDGLLSPRPLPGTTVKANICFFKNGNISIAGANNPDALKRLEATAKKLVQYFVDKEIVTLNQDEMFHIKNRLVNLDQYKVLLRQERKNAEEKKHKKKLNKARQGEVPEPNSVKEVVAADGSTKQLFFCEDDELVHWAHIEEPEPDLAPVITNPNHTPTLSGLTLPFHFPDLNDETEVRQCNESMFSERMNILQINMIDSQIHGLQAQIDLLQRQRDQISGAAGGYQTPRHRHRPVDPRSHRGTPGTAPRPTSPDQVTEDSGRDSKQQRERSPTHPIHDGDDDAPLGNLSDTPNAVEMVAKEADAALQEALDEIQPDLTPNTDEVEMMAEEADAELQEALDEIQPDLTPNTDEVAQDSRADVRCQPPRPSSQQYLERRLREHGMVETQIKADGNCQFRALAEQLFDGDQERYAECRAAAINQLRSEPDRYREFITEDWETYVSRMENDGEWGDNITLQAAADYYEVTAHVYSHDPEMPFPLVLPSQHLDADRIIRLSHHPEVHYNSVHPCSEAIQQQEREALDEIQPDPTPNAVEMMAEEADAELQEALDEIQPDPINESLIGTPGYPEWFPNKEAAQAGQGFYLTPYKVPRCGRCDKCNPVKGMKSSTCPMVIRDLDRKRKAPTSPGEKPPPKKKTAFTPDRTYTNLDGFKPFLNSVGKHRKINGLEFWFKQTPNNRKSKNDWDFIMWDPKKKSSIYFRDTNGIGNELKGSNVSHLRSLKAMTRYWDRRMLEILDAQYMTQQIPTEGSLREAISEEPEEEEPEEEEAEEEPEKGEQSDEPPSSLMAPKNATDFKPPSKGVRQNGKAPTKKEKETIHKAMAKYATSKTRVNIADMLISDRNSSLSSMSRSRVVGLMKELSPPPIWGPSEEKAYQAALTLKPKTPEAITEFMNRTMGTSYEQVHARMQQEDH
jgi:hypothetical protein